MQVKQHNLTLFHHLNLLLANILKLSCLVLLIWKTSDYIHHRCRLHRCLHRRLHHHHHHHHYRQDTLIMNTDFL